MSRAESGPHDADSQEAIRARGERQHDPLREEEAGRIGRRGIVDSRGGCGGTTEDSAARGKTGKDRRRGESPEANKCHEKGERRIGGESGGRKESRNGHKGGRPVKEKKRVASRRFVGSILGVRGQARTREKENPRRG